MRLMSAAWLDQPLSAAFSHGSTEVRSCT